MNTLLNRELDNGQDISIHYSYTYNTFDLLIDGIEVLSTTSLTELNSRLNEMGTTEIPTIKPTLMYDGKWHCIQDEGFKKQGIRCYAQYLNREFNVITLHNLDGKFIVTYDNTSELNLESSNEWVDVMDTQQHILGYYSIEPYNLICFMFNEYSLNSRDLRVDLTDKDIDREHYKSFNTLEKIIKFINNRFEVLISVDDFKEIKDN